MKKIISAVLLACVVLLLNGCKNDSAADTVVMDVSGVTVQNLSNRDESDVAVTLDTQNRLAAMLSELDNVNSAQVNISDPNVTAVLDISGEISQEEIDGAVKLIEMSLDGVDRENIVIFDQNNNVLYSV